METKVCIKCGKEKNINEYHFRDKKKGTYRNICKECVKLYTKQYNDSTKEIRSKKRKVYRDNNKEKIKQQKQESYKRNKDKILAKDKKYYKENAEKIKRRQREYAKKNKQIILERQREYYKNHTDERINWQKEYYQNHKEERDKYNKEWVENNKEYLREKSKQYFQENKERLYEARKEYNKKNAEKLKTWRREHKKERKATDPLYKLSEQTRTLINNSFRRQGYKKNSKTYTIVGIDYKTFYNYLLKTFKNNYGYEWDGIENVHIDHIVPVATATTKEDIIKLCHYTNLQLLKAKDNIKKSNKLDWSLDKNDNLNV